MRATMVARAEAYLYARRQLGFQLRIEGGELLRFARYADSSGHRGALTTELALRWAQEATTGTPLYRARRLEIVRCFAKHLAASEPATEIPPTGILGPAHRRTQPYIFDPSEISALGRHLHLRCENRRARTVTRGLELGQLRRAIRRVPLRNDVVAQTLQAALQRRAARGERSAAGARVDFLVRCVGLDPRVAVRASLHPERTSP